jgi:PhoH-like ATPase
MLFSGKQELPKDFWEKLDGEKTESWNTEEHIFYKISGPITKNWHLNQFLYIEDFEAIV